MLLQWWQMISDLLPSDDGDHTRLFCVGCLGIDETELPFNLDFIRFFLRSEPDSTDRISSERNSFKYLLSPVSLEPLSF